ncbi:hypothetical protein AB0L67_28530 [Streptomyces flaveolus]|uniref:hypothetical protein n=1 Tax=Streptomyces flaveolus TaxID=67297 RepID=UPI003446B124
MDTVDALLDTAGARFIPALRSIKQGTAAAALLDGLDGTTKIFFEDFTCRTVDVVPTESLKPPSPG